MRVFNRRARHDYELLDRIEAGISLLGPEVKSIQAGRMSLEDAFIRLKEGQAYLINAHIYPYQFSGAVGVDPRRTRKLLLHKKEVLTLEVKTRQKKLTIVPVLCYIKGCKVKLELALARGRREYEKRDVVKRKDIERQTEQELAASK